MTFFYDREGKPLRGVMDWAALMEDPRYQVLEQTTIGNFWISTVWLGLNHGYDEGPPLIFETMIFDERTRTSERRGANDLFCDRYSTENEAFDGHRRACGLVWMHFFGPPMLELTRGEA